MSLQYLKNQFTRYKNLNDVTLIRMGFDPGKQEFYKAWKDFLPVDMKYVTINAWRPRDEQLDVAHLHQVHLERNPIADELVILTRDPELKNKKFSFDTIQASLVDSKGNPLEPSEKQVSDVTSGWRLNKKTKIHRMPRNNSTALLYINQTSTYPKQSSVFLKQTDGQESRFQMEDPKMPDFMQEAFSKINTLIDQ